MGAPRALVVQHVPWEGPHRIGRMLAEAGIELDIRRPLDGDQLPAPEEVHGAVFMGGPMNVDEVTRYPGLLAEREWLRLAIAADMPVLGVCLGSQLIARALGAEVRPGKKPEIGWAPVEIHEPSDPLVAGLAPSTPVLHWHGDVFDLPPGATLLASSEQTPVQGFRANNAWGFLFHAEADAQLVDLWLFESAMYDEAVAALGDDGPDEIAADAVTFERQVTAASAAGFEAFAALIAQRASDA